ncbi:hypothetical protein SELMODRAFT_424504 [Selaginella moellendorffii]|uniref:Uncharacterized protein n=1 Tax=Selaginella moellendorffii TaxID=88036 RepID=D8SQ39_SELML|nr:hypothetical protein SELMODRAFT_424504 [Selaginella moellendorffii]
MDLIDSVMYVKNNGFKVGLHFTSPHASGHCCHIYDSATGVWSSLSRLSFSPANVNMRVQLGQNVLLTRMDDLTILGFYDFDCPRWRTGEVIRSLRITTRLEVRDGQVLRCVLPLPGVCASRLWEHNGQLYFASCWVYADDNRQAGYDGFGVWKVDDNGGLVTVSALLYDDFAEEVYDPPSDCYTHLASGLASSRDTLSRGCALQLVPDSEEIVSSTRSSFTTFLDPSTSRNQCGISATSSSIVLPKRSHMTYSTIKISSSCINILCSRLSVFFANTFFHPRKHAFVLQDPNPAIIDMFGMDWKKFPKLNL